MERKEHWQHVYTTKARDGVSWFQESPTVTVQLLDAVALTPYT
jgi:hypothetical protein